MPFIDYYQDDSPGTWFEIGTNPDNKEPVEVLVRTIPAHVQERNEKRYRKTSGRRRNETMPSPSERNNTAFANCSYAWVDCKNLTLAARDVKGAEFFAKELDENISVGADIVLDGRLTERIKWEIFRSRTAIFEKIAVCSDQLERKNIAEETELQENLETGSPSD